MPEVRKIEAAEVERIIALEEGHYQDVKRIEITPAKLSESVSAFANSSGGELFVGVAEDKITSTKSWIGFPTQESANAHLQVLESLSPLGRHYEATMLHCDQFPGYVLHCLIPKSREIINATSGTPYVRKGAQNLPVKTEQGLARLRLDKGIQSFENEALDVSPDRISNSKTILGFVLGVVPSAEPEEWLRKQELLPGGKPSVAGTLLFDDEPQVALPKRSAIKLYRYRSKKVDGDRDTLAFDPVTIEGCLYDQIYTSVAKTKSFVEEISKLGEKGLDKIEYPDETLHEIITNAVLHRDYSIASDIHIRIFDNRVEVESPGRLPGHVTIDNILDEQAARNGKIVRLINKFPDAPNKDVGEGLNTAFDAMKKLKLKPPVIKENENSVLVSIRHDPLASPADAVMAYLQNHSEITNSIGRDLTGITSENSMKDVFLALKKRDMIEPVPGKRGNASAWRKFTGGAGTGGAGTGGAGTGGA